MNGLESLNGSRLYYDRCMNVMINHKASKISSKRIFNRKHDIRGSKVYLNPMCILSLGSVCYSFSNRVFSIRAFTIVFLEVKLLIKSLEVFGWK